MLHMQTSFLASTTATMVVPVLPSRPIIQSYSRGGEGNCQTVERRNSLGFPPEHKSWWVCDVDETGWLFDMMVEIIILFFLFHHFCIRPI